MNCSGRAPPAAQRAAAPRLPDDLLRLETFAVGSTSDEHYCCSPLEKDHRSSGPCSRCSQRRQSIESRYKRFARIPVAVSTTLMPAVLLAFGESASGHIYVVLQQTYVYISTYSDCTEAWESIAKVMMDVLRSVRGNTVCS
ncbi:uncharacterized protein LOC120644648 [Panicum virgatum]|uniref:uncharacterized protein LOC120644648 n=1 Tax=Panicum virgatum TaxID=38727 RepID=UPI0019D58408|nr:uncharacterized protein LOC120644648 [Panicum virgatum]